MFVFIHIEHIRFSKLAEGLFCLEAACEVIFFLIRVFLSSGWESRGRRCGAGRRRTAVQSQAQLQQPGWAPAAQLR